MTTKLHIFDFDGTLVEQSTSVLLQGVGRWFEEHKHDSIAVASNQGGVGLRHWMERDKWGNNPASYPTPEKIASNFERFFQQIPPSCHVSVYLCFAYQSKKSGLWSPTPEGEENNLFWRHDWRKPAPGMLIQALSDYLCDPGDAVFVGDSQEDMNAALAANVSFIDAGQFFQRL